MRFDPVTLEGEFVRIVPAEESHAEAIAEFTTDELVAMLAGRPKAADAAGIAQRTRELIDSPRYTPLTILDKSSERPIGVTMYINENDRDRATEIGGTWLDPRLHGSACNPDCKLALLTHAFESVGVVRVQFRGDARNTQSRKAVEKLGATFEGVMRKHMPIRAADDTITGYRDSFVYGITDDEWPACRETIRALIDTRRTRGSGRA
ncbi:MAG: GNAT family protein [Planctomycetota bacterium]